MSLVSVELYICTTAVKTITSFLLYIFFKIQENSCFWLSVKKMYICHDDVDMIQKYILDFDPQSNVLLNRVVNFKIVFL